MENFDFIDCTSGKLDRAMYDDNTPIDPERFFEQRDPRFRASVFYPGTKFKGGTVYFHRSTDYTDPSTGEVKRNTGSGFVISTGSALTTISSVFSGIAGATDLMISNPIAP